MRLRTVLPVLALAPALLFAACGDDDDSGQPTATAAPGTPVPTGTATQTAQTPAPEPTNPSGAFQGSTNPVEAPAPANLSQAILVDVRAAAHEGYDRLVFEFSGSQVPGYSVKYGSKAISCGSGQDVTNFVGDGSAPEGLLLIQMKPAAAHNEMGESTAIRTLRPGLESLIHVFGTCDFEADVSYAVAVSDEQPFKVSTLANPPRLVIDVAQ